MTGVADGAEVVQPLPPSCRESQRLVEFSIRKPPSVAGYLALQERQPHSTVEIDTATHPFGSHPLGSPSEEEDLAGNP